MDIETPIRSAKLSLEKKYFDACYTGNIKTVEYMIKKEGKTIKNNEFLIKCLNVACDGDQIDVCKMILVYKKNHLASNHVIDVVSYVCKKGKLAFFKFYEHILNIQPKIYWLIDSCTSGNANLIKYIIDKLTVNHHMPWNDIEKKMCLERACESGSMECVKIFIKYYQPDWCDCLQSACRGGNMEIVKLIVSKNRKYSSNSYSLIEICWSGMGGNVDVINFIINKCRDNDKDTGRLTDFGVCLHGACCEGNLVSFKDIEKIVGEEIFATNIDRCMNIACKHGCVKIVEYLIEKGASDWNSYARNTCRFYDNYRDEDNIKILKILIKNGATDFDLYLFYACLSGQLDLIKVLVEKGSTDWNRGLIGACMAGYADVASMMIKYGATNFNEGLSNAYLFVYAHNSDADLCNILVSSGADNFEYLSTIYDFKLYCLWLKFKGIDRNKQDPKWEQLYKEYPPCVLLTGCLLTNKNNKQCHVKRLPTELYVLLSQHW